MMRKLPAKLLTIISVLAIMLAPYSTFLAKPVLSASVTTFSVTLSRLKASTAANQEILFVTPSGVDSGETITITWSADFTMNSFDFQDVDFAEGNSNNCTSASFSEETLVASGATSSQWNASLSSSTLTLQSGGASAIVAADRCVRIRIGTNATSGATGDTQITNGPADDDDTITVAGTFGDSGTATVDIISDDQVVVTATVSPTFTFALGSNSVNLGTLTASTTGSGTHTFSVATNAASGFTVTTTGATLTNTGNGSYTITQSGAANTSTQGTEEFGLNLRDNATPNVGSDVTQNAGTCSYASGFGTVDQFAFTAGSANTLATSTAPADCVYTASYIANISGATEPGTYSTTLTYVGTGNF